MKIFSALVSLCLTAYLFFEAHDMEGVSLQRMGYIIAAVILLTFTVFLFVPEKKDEQE